MANLNTTEIAQDLLGPSQRIYHQDLTTEANQPHLKVDKLGAGEFIFVDSVPPGQNPAHSYEQKGLLLSVERPATPISDNMGYWAAIGKHSIGATNNAMPERFVLTATFVEPKKVSTIPNQPPPVGTYAPSLLLSFGTILTGATSQFGLFPLPVPGPGQRLNVPGLIAARSKIAENLHNEVIDVQNPSPFTLVLHVERNASASAGYALLFVGDQQADSVHFTFTNGLTLATVLDNIRVGIGTVGATATVPATDYRASVYVTEFEIWAPTPIYHRDFRPREISLLGAAAWFTEEEKGSPGPHFPLGTMDTDGINLETPSRDLTAGIKIYSHSAALTNSGQPIPLPNKFQLRATFRFLGADRLPDPNSTPRGGKEGDAFEAAIVMTSAASGIKHVAFSMQTTDKTASPGRGVRIFVDRPGVPGLEPQEGDFLNQTVFDSLYDDTQPHPVFTLNAIVNKDPKLVSTAYLELEGNRFEMVRPYKIPSPFFDTGLREIRVLISSSKGEGLRVFVRVYEFEIVELKLTEGEKQILAEN